MEVIKLPRKRKLRRLLKIEMALKEAGFRNGWFLARRSAESPQERHADHLRRIGLDPDDLV